MANSINNSAGINPSSRPQQAAATSNLKNANPTAQSFINQLQKSSVISVKTTTVAPKPAAPQPNLPRGSLIDIIA